MPFAPWIGVVGLTPLAFLQARLHWFSRPGWWVLMAILAVPAVLARRTKERSQREAPRRKAPSR